MNDWARDAIFYHIYPLGMCGAPHRNTFQGPPEPRMVGIREWIGHLRALGVNALYLGPLFESTAHGYDTADFYHVDRRLGDNRLLTDLVAEFHNVGIRVILDGVFHHVGRDFWAFRDVLTHGRHSHYCSWFKGLDFNRRSPHGDPFSYEGWNGHYDLVKLNLDHPDVRSHLFDAVRMWINQFGIDGLRLDVADELDRSFVRDLAAVCRAVQPSFWLLGEVIHGDYRRLANASMLDSVTNYECYKGLYSSHNDGNFFEIAFALNRQFGAHGLYADLPLYAFADNHDVPRIASSLKNSEHLYPLHALLFTMPGAPSLYYGSEWGIEGQKHANDDWPLRPSIRSPGEATASHPDLANAVGRFAGIRHEIDALRRGSYEQIHVSAEQLVFARRTEKSEAIVAVNASEDSVPLDLHVSFAEGSVFSDRLEPDQLFTVCRGRLKMDVSSCWARILVRQDG